VASSPFETDSTGVVRLPVIETEPSSAPAAGTANAAAHAPVPHTGPLRDAHGRAIRDLRLSVTDRCNLRCVYCMAPDQRFLPAGRLLSAGELVRLAAVAAGLGVRRHRVTGGEPTVRPDLEEILAGLGRLRRAGAIDDLAMTTNGTRATPEALRRWRDLGLRRLTFSLDSLRPERVRAITRGGATGDGVRRGIDAARAAGLEPVRVNAVIVRGLNDDEVADFADFAIEREIEVRLIEWMPLDGGAGRGTWGRDAVVPADEMLASIRARHELVPRGRRRADATSLDFGFTGASDRAGLGLIAPVTRAFCGACSRMRITADGQLRPCLFSHREHDLRGPLRAGRDDAELARAIRAAMWTKQAGHGIDAEDFAPPERGMSAIGG